ncbi:hypothetical protein BD324DRAFT_614122 [Kockovaella imperatae]|uniref:Uncharacterized protein n=1 Tax=Kockovaella imperatae TaxID=4999 RepID=A0A1Y1UNG3_9TREE|nr:hypothetical protein BD324DRAFT_614122 [Kockovaella imperatae]ORX39549.1 hypothetical protein BD324DRAFT_614122 [Kockovaella imperatae]
MSTSVPNVAVCGIDSIQPDDLDSMYYGSKTLSQIDTTQNATLNVTFSVPTYANPPYNVSLVYQDARGNIYCSNPINRTGVSSDDIHMIAHPYVNFTVAPFSYPYAGIMLGQPGQSFVLELSGEATIDGNGMFWTTSANYSIVNATSTGATAGRPAPSPNLLIWAALSLLLVQMLVLKGH